MHAVKRLRSQRKDIDILHLKSYFHDNSSLISGKSFDLLNILQSWFMVTLLSEIENYRQLSWLALNMF